MLQHRIWQLTLPLTHSVDTPVGPFDKVHALVVRLEDGRGAEGAAYAFAMNHPALQRLSSAAVALLAGRDRTLEMLLAVERAVPADCQVEERHAAAAIAMACWDLIGRQRGIACADLWGRSAGRNSIDAYASGLFLDANDDALLAEASTYRAQNFRFAKMRGGRSAAEDARRYDVVCRAFSEAKAVAIDFVFQSSQAHLSDFLRHLSAEPLWIEDPVTYDRIADLVSGRRIAAGEVCGSIQNVSELYRNGVGRIILDVQYIGGPMCFLEAARGLAALGATVGSHMFAHESIHLLACLSKSLPVEVLDWWNPIFNEVPALDTGGRLAVQGPGLGRTLNLGTLERHGRQIG